MFVFSNLNVKSMSMKEEVVLFFFDFSNELVFVL